ncbi:phosphate ABC transporter, permease protein PstC [Rubidibacter lacunae KORDI 51-2]|uniref:Phosphate transport system permease protein n=1 Tax=Rubidibacter lacunae KORDI 51-2 TaxID=582515 RepID=U5DMF1_9CHRO|nr:phosphate ABC transporter permease subunit PstC [Rubidibacter lacunae]ERN40885.1 phosphate ABC transporter, permease protein PstC [Rubidibacter lacunae KORDI 51-2]
MTANQPPTEPDASLWHPNRTLSKWSERFVIGLFGLFALISVATTIGILLTLLIETFQFFIDLAKLQVELGRPEPAFWHFLTATEWTPLFVNPQFGIFVLISATFMVATIAISVALPIGLLSAIYLSEYAPIELRAWVKPALEVLAGVPTVVFGYFALLFVTPLLQSVLNPLLSPFDLRLESFNALSAGIVMGIMIVPLVASLSEDAIYAVPQSLRQGAYALGSTKREVVFGVVIPAALSGIVASFILAVSRAIGETMIVTVAAGANPNLTLSPLVPVQTMTAFIVQVSLGDAPYGSLAHKTLYTVGTTLFLLTLTLNTFSFWFVRKFREKYE